MHHLIRTQVMCIVRIGKPYVSFYPKHNDKTCENKAEFQMANSETIFWLITTESFWYKSFCLFSVNLKNYDIYVRKSINYQLQFFLSAHNVFDAMLIDAMLVEIYEKEKSINYLEKLKIFYHCLKETNKEVWNVDDSNKSINSFIFLFFFIEVTRFNSQKHCNQFFRLNS